MGDGLFEKIEGELRTVSPIIPFVALQRHHISWTWAIRKAEAVVVVNLL